MITLQSDIWLTKEVPTIDILVASGMSKSAAKRLLADTKADTLTSICFLDGDFILRVGKKHFIRIKERPLSGFERFRLHIVRRYAILDRDWLLPRMGKGLFVI